MVADVYRTHGDLKEAEQHWLRAIFHDPADIAAREALVGLYKRQRRTHDAIDVLVRLQKLDPQNALYPLEAGVLYVELQEFDAAEEAFERVLAVAPHDSRGYEALSRLYLKNVRNLPKALTLARKAAAMSPTAVNCVFLAMACEKNADLAGAIAAMEQAIQREPHNRQYREMHEQLLKKR